MRNTKTRILQEIKYLLYDVKLESSKKFKLIFTTTSLNDRILCVFSYRDKFLIMYMYCRSISVIYNDVYTKIELTHHFIDRFKSRYNDSDKWQQYLMKELTPVLSEYNKLDRDPTRINTRFGVAVCVKNGNPKRNGRKSFKCITYMPKSWHKIINPSEDIFLEDIDFIRLAK